MLLGRRIIRMTSRLRLQPTGRRHPPVDSGTLPDATKARRVAPRRSARACRQPPSRSPKPGSRGPGRTSIPITMRHVGDDVLMAAGSPHHHVGTDGMCSSSPSRRRHRAGRNPSGPRLNQAAAERVGHGDRAGTACTSSRHAEERVASQFHRIAKVVVKPAENDSTGCRPPSTLRRRGHRAPSGRRPRRE